MFNFFVIVSHFFHFFLFSLCSDRLTRGRLCAQPCPSARVTFPLATCGYLQRRTKGSPSGRLHSDAQVSQQETPKNCPPTYLSTACGTLKGGKGTVYMCVCCLLQAKIFSSHLYVISRASNQRVSRKFAKGSNPFSDIPNAI